MFSIINFIVVLFILIIQQWIVLKEKLISSAFLVLIYRGIVLSVAYTVISIGHQFGGLDSNTLTNQNNVIFLHKDFPIFIYEAILSLIILIIRHNTVNRDSVSKLTKCTVTCLSSILFIICLIFPFLGLGDVYCYNEYASVNLIVIIELFTVLTYDLIILCYLGKPIISNLYKRQLELAEIKNIMLQNSLNETEQSFELWKKSIHDYKNNIIALTQLAEEGNVDEIKAYLKEESKMLDNRMFYIKTGNSVADAIINTKCNKAKNKGINFSVNSVFEEQNSVSDVDLASILGNLLDNAIEASEKEDKPYISVNINKQKSFLIINISNKYTGNFSNTTQKKDKIFHGIGLKSVNRIVKKYGGQLNISRENDMIITKILIP
jgi:sensor histidine kinase YesM